MSFEGWFLFDDLRDRVFIVNKNNYRLELGDLSLIEHAIVDDDNAIAFGDEPGCSSVKAHIAGSAAGSGDDISFESRSVVDIDDLNLLVGEQVGSFHKVGAERDAADVVKIRPGDSRAVDFRLTEMPEHVVASLNQKVVDQACGAEISREGNKRAWADFGYTL